jgi:hypothetical protein
MPNQTSEPLVSARATLERFRRHGFHEVAAAYDARHFGNLVIELVSPRLCLQLTRDRGQYFISLRHPDDPEWFNEHTVLVFLGAAAEASALVESGWRDCDEIANAVESHIGEIVSAFSNDYSSTAAALHEIERKSAEERFGYRPPN